MSLTPNARHRRAADMLCRRLPVGSRSIVPKLGEPVWGQGDVAHSMLNIAGPQVQLNRTGIDPLGHKVKPASMLEHGRVNRHGRPGVSPVRRIIYPTDRGASGPLRRSTAPRCNAITSAALKPCRYTGGRTSHPTQGVARLSVRRPSADRPPGASAIRGSGVQYWAASAVVASPLRMAGAARSWASSLAKLSEM